MAVRRQRAVSRPQIIQIAAAIPASPKTVERVYDGMGSEFSRARVVKAAQVLGLPEPTKEAI